MRRTCVHHLARRSEGEYAGGWLCPTKVDLVRLVEMSPAVRRARILAGAFCGIGVAVMVPWLGWWPLAVFGLAPIPLLGLDWLLRRAERPERLIAGSLCLHATLILLGAARGSAPGMRRGRARPGRIEASKPAGLPVTASVGVCSALGEEIELGPTFEAADRALYEAKRGGRNCVAYVPTLGGERALLAADPARRLSAASPVVIAPPHGRAVGRVLVVGQTGGRQLGQLVAERVVGDQAHPGQGRVAHAVIQIGRGRRLARQGVKQHRGS